LRVGKYGGLCVEENPMSAKTSKTVRYAVVGLGHIAQVAVLPAFKNAKNSELVALVSSDPEKQQKLTEQYNVDRVYSYDQYEECLSQGVDAVYIALPNHLHRDYAIRALNAGVHVLCEKPLAVTEADCEAIIDAAQKNDRKLMVAYRLHLEKGNLQAIEWANNGQLGDTRFFSSEFAQQVVENNVRVTEDVAHGGGPLYDMGVYCINAARYLFRDEPTHVFATISNNGENRFQKTEEMTTVLLRFPKGRIATFTASFGAADVGRYTLVGTKGILTADPAYEYADAIKLELTLEGKRTKRTFAKRDQFGAELVYFSNCILRKRDPEPSGAEGLADVRVVQAAYESARDGRMIELPPFPEKYQRPNLNQETHRPSHGKPETIKTESPSGEAA
jgi:glucose-fructose oxidoreductase